MKKMLTLFICQLCLLPWLLTAQANSVKWLIYYNDKASFQSLSSYELLVFDSDNHPPLMGFNEKGTPVLGYLNIGEVENTRFYFNELKQEGLLLNENENWKGSYFIDLRDPRWAKRLIEQIIPYILFKHFDGLFLDTVDNAEFLEQQDPIKYKGMKQAAIRLIKAIRLHYPQIKIMLNRAYALLPELAPFIDMELGESVYSTYDFQTKQYKQVAESDYQAQVKLLKEAKKMHPHLGIYTVDYWNPEDTGQIKKIYEVERGNGFNPYVGTIFLNTIIVEPK